MPTLALKPTHKPVEDGYAALERFARLAITYETAVRAVQTLLETCARQNGWTGHRPVPAFPGPSL